MRLEGQPAEAWEPVAESARQHFRQLAEDATTAGQPVVAQRHREELDSAIRLARMDLGELQALPLPKQCKGCKSGVCKKPAPKQPMKPTDSRKAGQGPPRDGEGV